MIKEFFGVIFWYTGLIVWIIILFIALMACAIYFYHLWKKYLRPSIGNLAIAFFGKSRKEPRSYYQIWYDMSPWQYRYFTRGSGNRCFARLAMKRLIYEARKESLRMKNPVS